MNHTVTNPADSDPKAAEQSAKAAVLSGRDKPAMPPINAAAIPTELKDRQRWLGWNWVRKGNSWAKIPVDARTGHSKGWTQPEAWCSFEEALAAAEANRVDGIGIMLGDGLVGIDPDDCLDPVTGELSEVAKDIIATMQSYAEVSPTATGVKLFCFGSLPKGHDRQNKDTGVELYTAGRFFTVTGLHVEGTPRSVEGRQDELEAVYAKYVQSREAEERRQLSVRSSSSFDIDGFIRRNNLKVTGPEAWHDGGRRWRFVESPMCEHHNDGPFLVQFANGALAAGCHHASCSWGWHELRAKFEPDTAICNYSTVEVPDGKDKNGEPKTKTVLVPLSMGEIIDTIRQRTGNWPRRVDKVLFVEGEHGIDYFDRRTTNGLFGWLRRQFEVKWTKSGSFVAPAELFAEIERTAPRYDAIELLPHEPPIDGIYYHGTVPTPGDGGHLRWLLNRFRPETTVDRDLILAAFMTAFWGGPPGLRPAFVFTSDHGRGVGKSTVAHMIGHLCGGHIEVSANEDMAQVKTRLLTPGARTKRIALLDNVKSLRFSWAELEALITSPVISGKELYVGEGQRPNLLSWFITLNGVNLSTDMAQRSVIIKVVRGQNEGNWWEDTIEFIDQHREQIIGDIIGALRATPQTLRRYSRWATWERHVLSRLPNPEEAQRLLLERQADANSELEEAALIEEYFSDQLSGLGYDPSVAQVRIPVSTVATWYSNAVGQTTKPQSASKRLKQMAGEEQLKRLSPDPSRTYGRCFIWTGEAADVINSPIVNSLVLQHKDRSMRLAGASHGAASCG